MNVVFDIASLGRGGMERQVLTVAAGLKERGHSTTVVVNKRATAYEREATDDGVDLVELRRDSRLDARVVADLCEVALSRSADVLVGVNFNATMWSRLAGVRLGIPVVIAEHSTDRPITSKVVLSNRVLAPWTAACIACAEAQVPSLVAEGTPQHLVKVVRNGVDVIQFAPDDGSGKCFRDEFGIPSASFLIGLIAAHRPEKRHDRFFRLMERLRAHGANAHGVMVGDGPLLEEHRALSESLYSGAGVIVAGGRTDMSAVYSACDLVLLVSSGETFPLSLLESQSCGTPVAAIDVGGVRETFAPGHTGVLARDEDDLITQIRALVSSPGELGRLAAASRRWVSSERSLQQMIDGYERVLSGVCLTAELAQ